VNIPSNTPKIYSRISMYM